MQWCADLRGILQISLRTQPSRRQRLWGIWHGVVVGWIYLVREGRTPGAPTVDGLKHRYRRYRMRQKLRAVHDDARRERQRWWEDDDNDKNLH